MPNNPTRLIFFSSARENGISGFLSIEITGIRLLRDNIQNNRAAKAIRYEMIEYRNIEIVLMGH
jgi:hypothetical protein